VLEAAEIVARPAAGGFLTSRKARQENARYSAAQAAEDLQSASADECGEGEPGWRQPGKPAESAPLNRVAVETLLATFPGQGGEGGEAEKELEQS
jgi:hypothetical protein